MSLIKKIYAATQSGDLPMRFNLKRLRQWIVEMKIVKDDGENYANSSVQAILSNSDRRNNPTSNKNAKVLSSVVGIGGKREYWF